MTTTKHILIAFPDHSVWRVPALPIAEDRAKYYAKADPSTTFEAEVAYALDCTYELTDWMQGNMHLPHVQALAVQVKPPVPMEFEDGFRHDDTTFEVE